jgi:undecaprenyl-diphosphatase
MVEPPGPAGGPNRHRRVRSIESVAVELRAAITGQRTLLLVTFGALAVVAACGVLIAKLLDDVLGADGLTALDPKITSWMVDHRSRWLTHAARAVTRLGDTWTVVAVVVICVATLIALGRRKLGVFVSVSAAGSAAATALAKTVVGRPRPTASIWLTSASGAAFPSGHATQSVACYGALAVVGWLMMRSRMAKLVTIATALVVAVAVGGSRVYLGVHWTSDVLCGWAVATLWLATLVLAGWAGPRLAVTWRERST